ncbi:alpha/beta hydrolase [Paludibacter sp.]
MATQINIRSDYFTRTNLDGIEQKLFFTIYLPEKEDAKATLIMLHGMQEHSGRYKEVASYFAERGFAVLTYDHIGHGKTASKPEDHGYFSRTNGVKQLVLDAGLMTGILHKKYPDKPHFILGHSMGSFITRALLQESSKKFKAAVIVGTGGKIPGIGLLKYYLGFKNLITPHQISKFVNSVFSKMNNSHFKNEENATETSWLSLSKENQEAFLADSLNGIPFTNNGFYTLVSVNQRATKKYWAQNIEKSFPMLFVSGADCPIGNFSKGIYQTTSDLKNQGFANISVEIYPKLRHEILNETLREEVYQTIYLWMMEWL